MEAAFVTAGLALTAIVTDPANVKIASQVRIRCEESDPELLFLDFINGVIYEMDTRQMVFGQYEVTIHNGVLTAVLSGEPLDVSRHNPAVEVKGATLTELKVAQEGSQWCAQCVVDV